ncbi:RAP protein, putative [Plasmodium sp. gorilla clade G2]|uniref:RAP protein, putative n=1 Tax=Plasmodium sp. gorilla clade G2 TaxID=880535 RepID=UPI000D210524|nr:RAP protein, putative [Plasmodium sp. gorilla clade G2]SOV18361.1 RAP protein, putative [Plasmodium sp. gorilla clade G2]
MTIIRNRTCLFLNYLNKKRTCILINNNYNNDGNLNLQKKFIRTSKLSLNVLKRIKSEKNINIKELNKYLRDDNKMNLDIFKKLIYKAKNNNEIEQETVENLLLILVLFNKYYPYFQDNFYSNLCLDINKNLLNSIKFKIHYLYTSKMLIHTMNILTNLNLVDNILLEGYMNKCFYFIKNDEYNLEDLIHYLSILNKISMIKKNMYCKKLQSFNWSLIKIICDKLTYNFDHLFMLSGKNNHTSFFIKKNINEQIKNLSNDINNKVNRTFHKINYNENKINEESNIIYNNNIYVNNLNTSIGNMQFYNIEQHTNNNNCNNNICNYNHNNNSLYSNTLTIGEKKLFILETLLSISRSLKDLNYVHLKLTNEIVNKVKNEFLNISDGDITPYIDNNSVNKIFYIMQCLLYLKLDYHMFYKSVLNIYMNYLPFSNNLIILFFLLGKNKLFPTKTIHIFDSVFSKNIKQNLYDTNSLIILLESYSIHKYRQNDLIGDILSYFMYSNIEHNMCDKKIDSQTHNISCNNENIVLNKKNIIYQNLEMDLYPQDDNTAIKKKSNSYDDKVNKVENKNDSSSFILSSSNDIIKNNEMDNFTINEDNKKKKLTNNDTTNTLHNNLYNNLLLQENLKNIDMKNNNYFSCINISDKVKIFYSLFKLDIYEEGITYHINNILNNESIHEINFKLLIKLLLGLCYFSFECVDIYNLIITNLIKYDIILDNVYLTQLKICELAIRTQHVPNVYNHLNKECIEYLNCIKNKEKTIEYHVKSDLQKNVKNILLTFNITTLEEVTIGPYNVDFLEEDETFFKIPKNYILHQNKHQIKDKHYTNDNNNQNSINFQKCVNQNDINNITNTFQNKKLIIEVNGEHHFYKNTKSYISLSKFKHKLLSDLGYVVINIPYFDWAILNTDFDKKAYVKKLISDHSDIQIRNIITLNQKNEHINKNEMDKISKTIQHSKEKTDLLTNIQNLRKKNKIKFLRKKIKHI